MKHSRRQVCARAALEVPEAKDLDRGALDERAFSRTSARRTTRSPERTCRSPAHDERFHWSGASVEEIAEEHDGGGEVEGVGLVEVGRRGARERSLAEEMAKACDRIGDIDPRVAVGVAAGRAERRGEESPVVDLDRGDLRLRGGKRMAVLRADEDDVRELGGVARDIL